MPSLSVGRLVGCLSGKLKAQEKAGRHRKFEVFDDNDQLVGWTQVSHEWKGNQEIGSSMVSTIARQLGISTGDLMATVDCTKSRADYLEAARG